MSINAMFHPKGVAVIGSTAPGKLAAVLLQRLVDGGMENLYAVNPKKQGFGEIQGFSSVQEINEPVDMAVIASPASTVAGVMEDCGKAGIEAAVIISSGFSEVGNKKGEEEIMKIAKQYKIRVIGPNCAGLVSTHGKLVATLETMPPSGSISMISQSGAIGGSFMALCDEAGVGVSKFISYGNGADLDVISLLDYLETDPTTKVIAIYLESVSDGRDFMEAVYRVTKKKPVVIVKSGRTGSGQRAALSHTGSMAGVDTVFTSAVSQCGAIRANSLLELLDICKTLSLLPALEGTKLAIVTNSGGPGVMAADRADELGIQVKEPSPVTKEKLEKLLPPFAGIRNPIDLTVEGTGEQYQKAIETVLEEFDAAIAIYVGTPYLKAMSVAQGIALAAKKAGKPVAAFVQVGTDLQESFTFLQKEKVPCFVSGEKAVEALHALFVIEKMKELKITDGCFPKIEKKGLLFEKKDHLLEPEAMSLLKENGLPIPPMSFALDVDKAVFEAGLLNTPIVMKVVSPEIIHKSDVGGVALSLDSDEKVRSAFFQMQKAAEGKDFRGVVLYPMLSGGTEVIMGITRDPQFGPIIAFGMGGIYTEVLKDIVFRVAPISQIEAVKMIQELKCYPILRGVRGQKGTDISALASAISHFSTLPFLYPDIKEADLNPVFAFSDGLVIADVRILSV